MECTVYYSHSLGPRFQLISLLFSPTFAKDMLSCVPEMLRSMKRVINAGYAQTLYDGLQIEATAWREQVRGVTPDDIAARREGVQRRGRVQSS